MSFLTGNQWPNQYYASRIKINSLLLTIMYLHFRVTDQLYSCYYKNKMSFYRPNVVLISSLNLNDKVIFLVEFLKISVWLLRTNNKATLS